MVNRAALAGAAVLATALGGCTLITDSFLTNEFSGDQFPTHVDTSTGAIIVGIHPAGAADDQRPDAVLDLLSPITVIDSGPNTEPSVSYGDLLLLGDTTPGAATRVTRARFPDAQLVALHPCPDRQDSGTPDESDDLPNPDCRVGVPAASGAPDRTRIFRGVVGADVLAGDAVRLRLGDDQIFVLADIGGGDRSRGLACDAVFSSPYRGGGTLVIAGTELPFGNRRITLQACLGADPDPDPVLAPDPADEAAGSCKRVAGRKAIADGLHQRGADVLLVMSTSTGISILGAAAYRRYVLAHPGAPVLETLADDAVYLPSGLVRGRRATIDRIALVAASSSNAPNALAPCRQIYAHRLLSALGAIETSEFEDCTLDDGSRTSAADFRFTSPCKDGTAFCPVPSILELARPAGIDVLVVEDSDAALQALRAELRPDQPEVDGILGTDALRTVELDVDYPHDRVLARCPAGDCVVRPPLAAESDRCQINRCLKRQPDLRDLPPAAMAANHLPACAPPQ